MARQTGGGAQAPAASDYTDAGIAYLANLIDLLHHFDEAICPNGRFDLAEMVAVARGEISASTQRIYLDLRWTIDVINDPMHFAIPESLCDAPLNEIQLRIAICSLVEQHFPNGSDTPSFDEFRQAIANARLC